MLAAPGVTAPFRGEALYLRAMVRLVTGDGAAAYRDIARKTAARLSLRARNKAIAFPKVVAQ